MKRPLPWDGDGNNTNNNQVNLVSSDDSDTEDPRRDPHRLRQLHLPSSGDIYGTESRSPEGLMLGMAKMYQEYMKSFAIPARRGSVVPFNSWTELGKSLKQLYGQPLHYLTYKLLKQWDQDRFETENDLDPLDTVIHPLKAEATIWLLEEVHRYTVSFRRIARLWMQDPMYHAFVDPFCLRFELASF